MLFWNVDSEPQKLRPYYHKPDIKWHGYFRLNMNILPASKDIGWIAGSGDSSHNIDVDFLLAVDPLDHQVSRTHFRVVLEKDTEILCLIPYKEKSVALVPLDQADNKIFSVLSEQVYQLHWKIRYISVGKLQYRLHWTNFAEYLTYIQTLGHNQNLLGLDDPDLIGHMHQEPHVKIGDFILQDMYKAESDNATTSESYVALHRPRQQLLSCLKFVTLPSTTARRDNLVEILKEVKEMVNTYRPISKLPLNFVNRIM